MAPQNSGQGGNLAATQPLRTAGNMGMGGHEDMRGATDRAY